MKKIIIAFLFIQLVSCDKVQDCPDIPIQGKPEDHLINDQDLSTVMSLFKSNNLDFSNLQFYGFTKDDLGIFHVRCYQFVNNLKVFTDDLIFHFSPEGHSNDPTGTIIDAIDIDSIPRMDLSEVKSIFIKHFNNDEKYTGNKEKITSGCLDCELGYFDLNAGISYSVPDFKLAWRVSSYRGKIPFAYINDIEKTVIYYDNGIRY